MSNRLYGDVTIAVPVRWQLIAYLLLGAVLAAILFLSFASYSRVERARGTIVPDGGVLEIVPPTSGVISSLAVNNGDRVVANQPLVWIAPAETGRITPDARRQLAAELQRRRQEATTRGRAATEAAAAEQARLDIQSRGFLEELRQLDEQIRLQAQLVDSASVDLQRVRVVAERGFVSQRDVLERERLLIQARQRAADLREDRESKRSRLVELTALRQQRSAQTQADAATLRSEQAELAEQFIRAQAAEAYSVNSPVSGIVTAVSVRRGERVDGTSPMMVVLPEGTRLRANLIIPQQAIGFVAAGQSVNLMLDAFPYQTFGVVPARIIEVSTAPGASPGQSGTETSTVYLATAELSQSAMAAFGRERPLRPGMTFEARIETRRQSLLEWLFEPLFAVARR